MNDQNLAQNEPSARSIRLWPGVVAVALQWFLRYPMPYMYPDGLMVGIMGSLVLSLVVVLWWLFLSRVPWSERFAALGVLVAAGFATHLLLHDSIATGSMGLLFPILVLPLVCMALVLWAAFGRNLAQGPRWAALVALAALACAPFALMRTGGSDTDFTQDFAWRWAPTPEELLIAQSENETMATLPTAAAAGEPAMPDEAEGAESAETEPAAEAPAEESSAADASAEENEEPQASPADPAAEGATAEETAPTETAAAEPAASETTDAQPAPALAQTTSAQWPGFRGPQRDSILRGTDVSTDWSTSPPSEVWRHPVGPGWSSFAVRGPVFYTQEQRGDDELVSCYLLETGQPVWRHRDAVRFWESIGGAGPRGTPTIHGDRVYTLGGTGLVNVLDANDGTLFWSRDAAADTGAKLPTWGFSGSPLVVDDLVLVAVSGSLIAYDLESGDPRWTAPTAEGDGYSSPHLATIDGTPQILQLHGDGIVAVAPEDGEPLWSHDWSGYPIVQPALLDDGLLFAVTQQSGLRRLGVSQGADGWDVEERWTSIRLKPYFNDFVVHEGHAYGFDGNILASIDLETGERNWKGGRYGGGQLVLLADQDLLLVLSEKGRLALVSAVTDGFTELANVPALDDKTWNHPVLVDDLLLVRNDREMVAFRLASAP